MIPFLVEWWAGVKLNFFMKAEDYEKVAKESAIVVLNHKYDIDWAVGWVIGDRCKILGVSRMFVRI